MTSAAEAELISALSAIESKYGPVVALITLQSFRARMFMRNDCRSLSPAARDRAADIFRDMLTYPIRLHSLDPFLIRKLVDGLVEHAAIVSCEAREESVDIDIADSTQELLQQFAPPSTATRDAGPVLPPKAWWRR